MVFTVSPSPAMYVTTAGISISCPSTGGTHGTPLLSCASSSVRAMSLVPSHESASSAHVSPCITVWCPGAGTSRRMPGAMTVPPCTSRAFAPTSTVSRLASP